MYNVKVNPDEFRLEVPKLHPLSIQYKEFWQDVFKKMVHGVWVSGVWMPGPLYCYVNICKIKLNRKGSNSKTKVLGNPFLRDLEWQFFYNYVEAKGFSSFSDEQEYTCIRDVAEYERMQYDNQVTEKQRETFYKYLENTYLGCFKYVDGKKKLKKYIEAREYLHMQHEYDKGYPEYENPNKNLMMLGSRGFGKSYSVSGLVVHEFITDSINRVTEEIKSSKPTSVVMVGAGDAKYSNDLLGKVKIMLDNLPGAVELDDKYYPSPFHKQCKGSFLPSSNYINTYKKKIKGKWVDRGTNSTIAHRTFKDNPFAANGLRCNLMIYEEIGMFNNLIESHNASVECMQDGSNKFGTAVYLGTGGDMSGGGTLDASKMFYSGDSFDLITFHDEWENKGQIAYFVPAYYGLNDYKDEMGNTDIEAAKEYLLNYRAKLKKGKGSQERLDSELQNRPLKPSEAFLVKSGNIFPVGELKEQLTRIEENDKWTFLETPVTLLFDPDAPYGVKYEADVYGNLKPINTFPWKSDDGDRDGAVIIYEHPVFDNDGKIPKDMYLIGHDPYASDDPNGESLASIYVLKTDKYMSKHGGNEIVAEFNGRPYQGRHIVNDILMKLSMYYGNAKVYFENVRGNVKEYFEKHKKLGLLSQQPQTVLSKKASYATRTAATVYGYPMSSKQMKMEMLQYIRDFLLEEAGDGQLNLNKIWSRRLLQELISFNLEGNFDSVMAFGGCIIGREERINKYTEELEQDSTEEYLNYFASNRKLFPNAKISLALETRKEQIERLHKELL